jgi:hypothetical protein
MATSRRADMFIDLSGRQPATGVAGKIPRSAANVPRKPRTTMTITQKAMDRLMCAGMPHLR